ncbi:MAG TPA: glycerol dehydrogenase [Bacillota bacterium]|nr:glycerol dehydrogenase [Bacillota bacterium]
MITTTIFPGRYIQGEGAIRELGKELARFGKNALLICDPYIYDEVLSEFLDDIEREIKVQTERFTGECSDEEIARLAKGTYDVIVGIGGGKSLDTAKAVGFQLKVPVVVVPTLASTDAPCSALSVIYTPEGSFKRYLLLPRNPAVVLVDTGIVARAPVRFLVSGIGDALATMFEAESCRQKFAGNMTGRIGSMTAYSLAQLCYETLLEYGLSAKLACEAHVVTPALEHIVEANTLLSGLGFESGGLAAAHAIHNGMTVAPGTHGYFHGEKVAIGTLASLFLTDQDADVLEEVYDFCESVGLPVTLAGIGLDQASDEELMRIAEAACAEGETIHNEPRPVGPKAVFSALKAADIEGRYREQIW